VRWEAKRDTALVIRTAFFGLITFFLRSKAVSSMQGCPRISATALIRCAYPSGSTACCLSPLRFDSKTLRVSEHVNALWPACAPSPE
jgi:hypothetical protein